MTTTIYRTGNMEALMEEIAALVIFMRGASREGEVTVKFTVKPGEAVRAEVVELYLDAAPVEVPSPS